MRDWYSSRGWRPQKAYEYMAFGNRIMLINGAENSELRSVLARSKNNIVADSAADIKNGILRSYEEFKGGGRLPVDPPAEYSMDRIAEDLCRIIEDVPQE